LLHEAAHAVAAMALGCRVAPGLSRDGVALSPSVHIEGCRGHGPAVVLYAPYLVNAVLAVAAPFPLRVIALLMLPNALLEDENRRSPSLLALAVLLEAVIAALVALAVH